jgi:transcriptional regulator
VDTAEWLRRQIEDLTHLREGARAVPWAVQDAPTSFIEAQIKGIIGVEIPIARSEGKWKVSQNRPEADRVGVIEGFRRQGIGGEPMATLVAERSRPETQ